MVVLVPHIDACSSKWKYAFDLLPPTAHFPLAKPGKKRKIDAIELDDENEGSPLNSTRSPSPEPTPSTPQVIVPPRAPQLESPLDKGANYFETSLDNGKLFCICKCKEPVVGRSARAPNNYNNVHGLVLGKHRFLLCKWSHFSRIPGEVREALLPICQHLGTNQNGNQVCKLCKASCGNNLAISPPRRLDGAWYFCSLSHLLDFGGKFLSSNWTEHCKAIKKGVPSAPQSNEQN